MLEPNHSSKRRRGKTEIQSATVRTKGITKQRKIRLIEMLRNSLRGEQELDEHGQVQVTPTQKYFLPLPNGSTTEVCRPFFCLALGTTPRSTAFKNAIRAVQETVLRDKDQPHLGNIEDMNAIPRRRYSFSSICHPMRNTCHVQINKNGASKARHLEQFHVLQAG